MDLYLSPMAPRLRLIMSIMSSENIVKPSYEDLTPRMWDLTNMGISPMETSPDDEACYQSYLSSVEYINDKYWVRLPWRRDSPSLPNNYCRAKAQTLSLLRNLRGDPKALAAYQQVLDDKGFIEVCRVFKHPQNDQHYLPHFGVAKDSETTPVHLVYNA